MALHRVVKFEATADILGTIRRVCYDLDEQRLVIETINLEEAMVMLHRLEAAAPAKVTIPSTEVDLVAALEAAAINEPRPSFEHAATVTITTQTPVPTIAMTPVEASIEVRYPYLLRILENRSWSKLHPREEQAKHGQTNEEIHPADAPPTIVAPANPTPEVPVATLPKPVVARIQRSRWSPLFPRPNQLRRLLAARRTLCENASASSATPRLPRLRRSTRYRPKPSRRQRLPQNEN